MPTHTDTIVALVNHWFYVALVVNLALVVYIVSIIQVGRARARYKIMPPVTSGHPDFERYYRVQMNTLEQLVPFIFALLLFAGFTGYPLLAADIGALWLVGRVWYMVGYYKATEKRAPGFIISQLSTVVLVLGSLGAIVRALL